MHTVAARTNHGRMWWMWSEVSPFKQQRPSMDEVRARIAERDSIMREENCPMNALWQGRVPAYLMEFMRDWCLLPGHGLCNLGCLSLQEFQEEYELWTVGRSEAD